MDMGNEPEGCLSHEVPPGFYVKEMVALMEVGDDCMQSALQKEQALKWGGPTSRLGYSRRRL